MTVAFNRTEKYSIDFFGCVGDYAELSAAMLDRTAAVLASGQVLGGPDVAMFEARVATLAGRKHAVAVGSGTDALFFALLGAGIEPGDEVLVPAISFVASASAILRARARPVFVDIGSDVAIDLDRAAQLITPATRALVHVHLFGAMSDPERAERFAARYRIALVEDYAQSFGASYSGRPAGSLGIASATSSTRPRSSALPAAAARWLPTTRRLRRAPVASGCTAKAKAASLSLVLIRSCRVLEPQFSTSSLSAMPSGPSVERRLRPATSPGWPISRSHCHRSTRRYYMFGTSSLS